MKSRYISSRTRRFLNRFLIVAAIFIVVLSSYGIQMIVTQISDNERDRVTMWASSVQQKAQLIVQSKDYFDQLEIAERNRLRVWSEALTRLSFARSTEEFDFYRRTVDESTAIPCIFVTGANLRVLNCLNTDLDCSKIKYLTGALLEEYSKYEPIVIQFGDDYWSVYYKQSNMFSQLQEMLDGLINSFLTEIVSNSVAVPVLLVTEDEKMVIDAGNISSSQYADSLVLKGTLERMRSQNKPIEISDGFDTYFIFYENSGILNRLTYIPMIFLAVITAFILAIVFIFSTSRRSEKDKLWVGMSRETAHQLGTPLSSLIGWMEYLRTQNVDLEFIKEIEKDIDRLKIIAERFSKIGSEPAIAEENLVRVVYNSISYLQSRLSRKIKFEVNVPRDTVVLAHINPPLVEWVLENLFRNAADAIGANEGLIQIEIFERHKTVVVDVTDNGKGLSKDRWDVIFDAGYTTKTRGWGLGLTLSHRIIHDYHKGKIFVKQSVTDKGTTFRIIFNK